MSSRRCATKGSTPCRRRSRATSRSWGSSRSGASRVACVYALPGAADLDRLSELAAALRRWVVGLESTGNLVVVRTPPGCANALAQIVDEVALPEIAGCIAGDDTIFLAAREGYTAPELAEQLRHHLDGDT